MPKKITLSDRVEHLEKQMQSPIIVPRGEPIEVNQESSWKEWIIPCLVIVSMCFIGCYLGLSYLNLEEKVIPAVNEEEKTVLQEKVEPQSNIIEFIAPEDFKWKIDIDEGNYLHVEDGAGTITLEVD